MFITVIDTCHCVQCIQSFSFSTGGKVIFFKNIVYERVDSVAKGPGRFPEDPDSIPSTVMVSFSHM